MSQFKSNAIYRKMEKTTIEFLKKNDITAFPIKVKLTKTNEIKHGEYKIKKDLQFINHPLYKDTKGYNDLLNKELCEKRMKLLEGEHDFNFLWIDTRNVYQIDIDTNENIPDFILTLVENMPYYVSGSKSYGKHIFINSNDEFYKNKYVFEENNEVEFLCGIGAYMPIDAVIKNIESMDLEDNFHLSQKLKNYEQPNNEKHTDIEAFKSFTPFHKEILDNIKTSFYSCYDERCRFIWAIKFSFQYEKEALEIADFYSKKEKGYKSFEFL